MVNPGEVPIKAVIINKPKMLSGLDQKVRGQASGAGQSPIADGAPPADTARPNSRVIQKMNEVTPLSPREGRRTAKNADEAAAEG